MPKKRTKKLNMIERRQLIMTRIVACNLSTPMLTCLLGSDRFFLELDENDQQLIDAVKAELVARNWPACLSDAELKEAEMAVPMGDPIVMVAQEMDRRGLKAVGDVDLTPEQADAIETGAKFCEQHGVIPEDEESCPGCEHADLIADMSAAGVTRQEFEHVLACREDEKEAAAWLEAKNNHDPEACGLGLACEFCVEIEHDRMMAEGEIAVE